MRYTNVILTVIAGLLALNTLTRFGAPIAHAQTAAWQYSIVGVKVNWSGPAVLPSLESAINDAAKGRELVTVLPFDQPGRYMAVYRQQGH